MFSKEVSYAHHNFCRNHDIFLKDFLMNNAIEHHLFKIEMFFNIINAFTLTFKQFNVSLLNKSNI